MRGRETLQLNTYTIVGKSTEEDEKGNLHPIISIATLFAHNDKECAWLINCLKDTGNLPKTRYKVYNGVHAVCRGKVRYIGRGEKIYTYPHRLNTYVTMLKRLRQSGYKQINYLTQGEN